ncbi:hypothetical protein AB9K34_21760 [Sedimentitalea sp. XS_ASV28]|uniref:hypothetical protein n=1 Tax=Sedimentitalea sp. XS_ASV28 TaxID=3241296 RepID=UPI003518D8CD
MPSPDEIRAKLLEKNMHNLVCQPRSKLVIEGYPRSANTFSVDMINVICDAAGRKRPPMGHHTHSVRNLRLGALQKIPLVVLIRDPAAAILSFKIFSGRPVPFCLKRYVTFYSRTLQLNTPFILGEFEETVNDFNALLTRLNAVLDEPLPLSEDLARDSARAQELARTRAARRHGDKATERVGVPNEKREALKQQQRAEVEEALAQNPEPMRLYREILARGR